MSESLLASEDGGDPSEFQFIHELTGSPGATSTMKYPPPVTYLPSFVSRMRFYLKHFNLALRHQCQNISEILKEKVDLKSW